MKKTKMKEAFKKLADFVPECWPLNITTFKANQAYMGKIDKDAPFVSEATLYTILGKEDARTFRALLRNFAIEAGIPQEDTFGL